MIRRAAFVLALAWGLLALFAETRRALEGLDRRALPGTADRRWQFGTPRVDRLAAAVAAARQLLPPGSALAVASPADAAEFDRTRWAAYLLPEHHVFPLADPRSGDAAQFLLTLRRPMSHPRLELVRELPGDGRLYRVRP